MKNLLLNDQQKYEDNNMISELKVYSFGDYQINYVVTNYKSCKTTHRRIDVYPDFSKRYLPCVYFDSFEAKSPFRIQTTSYGSLLPEEIGNVIDGYNQALELIEALKESFC